MGKFINGILFQHMGSDPWWTNFNAIWVNGSGYKPNHLRNIYKNTYLWSKISQTGEIRHFPLTLMTVLLFLARYCSRYTVLLS